MGRHGGGSRSGGSRSRSSSRGSSRGGSGGSSSPPSVVYRPRIGYYNRSYYSRSGKRVKCYSLDADFGKEKKSFLPVLLLSLLYIFCLLFIFNASTVRPRKVNGNQDRLYINDTIDIFTKEEENQLLQLTKEVYNESGMAITVYTDDFSYEDNYSSIEAYSEDIYYSDGSDEKSMVILYTEDYTSSDFKDWNFDIYCGDGTYACLSDAKFDTLISTVNKNIRASNQSGYGGILEGLNYLKADMMKTEFDYMIFIVYTIMVSVYLLPVIIIKASNNKKSNDAYNYFKENPDKLNNDKIKVLSRCPSCGASNDGELINCEYCNSLLKETSY